MEPSFITHNKYKVYDHITLTQTEREIFELFTDFLKAKKLKTTIRVVGGWVRDKVNYLKNQHIILIKAFG